MNFRLLNFCAVYTCEGTVNIGSKEIPYSDCCFRYITKYHGKCKMDNTYTIYLMKGTARAERTNGNNMCFMNHKDIVKHLHILQTYYPFTFKVTNGKYGPYDCFKLKIHITGDCIYHKFLLTLIRPLYEFPFNVLLLDAGKLRNLSEFRFKSVVDLLMMAQYMFEVFGGYYCDDQSLLRHATLPGFMSKKQVAEKLKKQTKKRSITTKRIQEVYNKKYIGYLPNELQAFRNDNSKYKTLFNDKCYTQEFWLDNFEDRKKIYVAFAKVCSKIK